MMTSTTTLVRSKVILEPHAKFISVFAFYVEKSESAGGLFYNNDM